MIMTYSQKFPVTTARFANVAFSNGSLPQGFLERISKKQPISAPNDVTRYFVSPEESGQICLLATFLGETGNIFFPKLDFDNDQIYFKEIALDFLNENGFEPELVKSEKEAKEFDFDSNPSKYPIYFFKTDTSGEKTYEEFFTEEEDYEVNTYDSLGFINTPDIKISFEDVEADFESVFNNPNSQKLDIVTIIKKYVPDFMHIETGKHLDQKM